MQRYHPGECVDARVMSELGNFLRIRTQVIAYKNGFYLIRHRGFLIWVPEEDLESTNGLLFDRYLEDAIHSSLEAVREEIWLRGGPR